MTRPFIEAHLFYKGMHRVGIDEDGRILAPYKQFPASTLAKEIVDWLVAEYGFDEHDLMRGPRGALTAPKYKKLGSI
ncbi:hypothetical protein LRP52_43930 [Photobacterium sp. ZSDE20]|uniref:Uncharacterized protein n=1 Tax=Photobacterium pectinilyticum TaxID=2906793 RepID=A0ABT1NCG8_9GAMM|nr:hypothetical protein [Photobacterium sp. ZSDE20]MCQ1061029.1 hypothetical protein [Photobacterium sp. ZSDE20]MDD1829121.1 hypothetical protein [Photobacterium sp. ZSDE20]